jgi:hypothetical protein
MTIYSFPAGTEVSSNEFDRNGNMVREIVYNPEGKPLQTIINEYNREGTLVKETLLLMVDAQNAVIDTQFIDLQISHDSLNRISERRTQLNGLLINRRIYSYSPLTVTEYSYDSSRRIATTMFERPGLERSITHTFMKKDLKVIHQMNYTNYLNNKGLLSKRKITVKSSTHSGDPNRLFTSKGHVKYKYLHNDLYFQIIYSNAVKRSFTYEYY